MDVSRIVEVLQAVNSPDTAPDQRRAAESWLVELRDSAEAWRSAPEWLAMCLSQDQASDSVQAFAFFALAVVEEGARSRWRHLPAAERAAARAAVEGVLAPAAGAGGPALQLTGKAAGALVEMAVWEWPESDPGLLARRVASARDAVAGLIGGADPATAVRRAMVDVEIVSALLGEAVAAAAASAAAGRVASAGGTPATTLSKTSAALASDTVAAGSSVSETVGALALSAVADVMASGAVDVGADVIEAVGKLSDSRIARVVASAPQALAGGRSSRSAELDVALTALHAVPAPCLAHGVAAVAAAAAAAWQLAASNEVDDALAEDPACGVADGAWQCLSAAAGADDGSQAAAVALRLAAAVEALAEPVAVPPGSAPATAVKLGSLSAARPQAEALRVVVSAATVPRWFAATDEVTEALSECLSSLFLPVRRLLAGG
ncbi:hypothetical protein FNF29_04698 [Cafeteria roenbergensis]|uniref:Uncharacterized protein n=1 Tax=Cafeteria roenbergensis TaxID=33653 RepID=A0A5A8CDK6_CAFRO|nr:hypothetical protein FNF29_04698 [Cafeteria roenbergensis]|eukprot:KAA0151223.1 hypothetical protein FNF29_04698 [Cafeteria roenbergensis]